jgi:hypothetical protein
MGSTRARVAQETGSICVVYISHELVYLHELILVDGQAAVVAAAGSGFAARGRNVLSSIGYAIEFITGYFRHRSL